MANIAVFCGSSFGIDERYRASAQALGSELAAGGHGLIYGGGHVGLMGVVADAVLSAGGSVTGVITTQLMELEVGHGGLTTLDVVPTMHERKARMVELADGVVVLPGGFGTCDETFELLTWNQLGIVAMPVVFFDVAGFFAPLFDFIEGSVAAGFMKPEHGAIARRASSAPRAVEAALQAASGYSPKWVDQ